MLERQTEGVQETKKAGKYKGPKRVPKPSNFETCYESFLNRKNNYTFKQLMCDTGLKKSTLYGFIKKYHISEENQQ